MPLQVSLPFLFLFQVPQKPDSFFGQLLLVNFFHNLTLEEFLQVSFQASFFVFPDPG